MCAYMGGQAIESPSLRMDTCERIHPTVRMLIVSDEPIRTPPSSSASSSPDHAPSSRFYTESGFFDSSSPPSPSSRIASSPAPSKPPSPSPQSERTDDDAESDECEASLREQRFSFIEEQLEVLFSPLTHAILIVCSFFMSVTLLFTVSTHLLFIHMRMCRR
jgi:hypothetical protein